MDKTKNTPPPWSGAPPWAMWMACDEDGTWWFFEREPVYRASRYFGFQWLSDYGNKLFRTGKPNPNWRNSLQKRPENE